MLVGVGYNVNFSGIHLVPQDNSSKTKKNWTIFCVGREARKKNVQVQNGMGIVLVPGEKSIPEKTPQGIPMEKAAV